jgi:hypothetical protein
MAMTAVMRSSPERLRERSSRPDLRTEGQSLQLNLALDQVKWS